MKISFLFAWYDLWFGFFWDKKKRWLYILPLPMIGIILKFPKKEPFLKRSEVLSLFDKYFDIPFMEDGYNIFRTRQSNSFEEFVDKHLESRGNNE